MSELRSSRIPARTEFRHWSVIPTRWHDNDHYGHVNNAVYYAYFDTAISGLLMQVVGSDVRKLDAIGVVAETGCRYLKELSYPDLLNVGVKVEKIGRSSVIYNLGIFRGDEDVPAAIGRFTHVYVGRETHKVAQIPEIVQTALANL